MADVGLGAAAVAPHLLNTPATPADAAELAKRGAIKQTAQKYEASFLSVMLQQMFDGVDTSAPFGGGPGEAMFKSFLTEAMANQMAKAGGIGISAAVSREMLKLQGLS